MGNEAIFRQWLANELVQRNWSHNEFARRAGISQAQISSVLKAQRSVTCAFCIQVAGALNEPPERLLRLAGILPPEAAADADLTELMDAARLLTPEQRQEVLQYIRFLRHKT